MAESGGYHFDDLTIGDSLSIRGHNIDDKEQDEKKKEIFSVFDGECGDSQRQPQSIGSLTFWDEITSQLDLAVFRNESDFDTNEVKDLGKMGSSSAIIENAQKTITDEFVTQNFVAVSEESNTDLMKIGLLEDNDLDAKDTECSFDNTAIVAERIEFWSPFDEDCFTYSCSSCHAENERNAYQPSVEMYRNNVCIEDTLDSDVKILDDIPSLQTENINCFSPISTGFIEMLDSEIFHNIQSEDGLQYETEIFHSASSSTTNFVENLDTTMVELSTESFLVNDYETSLEIQSQYIDKPVQTMSEEFNDDKEIQTAIDADAVNNAERGVDKEVQCDLLTSELSNDTKQPLMCSRCKNVNKVDAEIQCHPEKTLRCVTFKDQFFDYIDVSTNEKNFCDKGEDDTVGPTSVKSDTALCNGYKIINRTGRLIQMNEKAIHSAKIKPSSKPDSKRIAKSDKRKRGCLRRFEKGDGSEHNGHCYQMAYDSAANVFYSEDGFYEYQTRLLTENADSGENCDVDDGPDIDDEEQYRTFDYLLNNCTPTFPHSPINITRSVFASSGNLNTTNSCDPNPSDEETNGHVFHKTTEKPYHSRFDNLATGSTGSYLKEYLSGNNNKFTGVTPGVSSYNTVDSSKTRTGMFLNTLNKKKMDTGRSWMMDGSNNGMPSNRLAQMDEKGKVQASQFIGEYLYELWKNECLCDVSIKVGTQSYLAHKIVLAAFSDVFCPSEPMPTPTLMVDVPNSSPNAVFEILQYLYTSEMKITDDSLEDILNAALFLGVTDVVELIKDILAHPTKENVVHYLEVADRMQMPVNINDTPQLFREYLHEIWDSEIFKHITEEEMRKLLSDQMIMVDSETDLIIALSKWAEGDLDKRVKLVPKLLKYINFVRIEPDDLAKTTDNYPHIFNNTECQAILAEVYKSFAIIETSALKGDNVSLQDIHKAGSEEWRPNDDMTSSSRMATRGSLAHSTAHSTGTDMSANLVKSHLTPDTNATRRSINNQFRRASKRMSQGPFTDESQNTSEDPRLSNTSSKRIQFDEKDGRPPEFKKSNFERKDTAMPPKEQRNMKPDSTPITLHKRSMGAHGHGLDSPLFPIESGARIDNGPSNRDYFANSVAEVSGYDHGHSKPGGGGGYLSKERVGHQDTPTGKDNKHASYNNVTSNKDPSKSSKPRDNMQHHSAMKRESVGFKDMDMGGVKESPLDKYKNELNADKMKSGFNAEQHNTGRRDSYKSDKMGNTGIDYPPGTPMNIDSDCGGYIPNIPNYMKCPSSRMACCNADCPPAITANCNHQLSSAENSTSSKVGAPTRPRSSLRDHQRTSLRDTARATRRSATRSPMKQHSRSPPNHRRSTTPPPRKTSETPPVHRSETPPNTSRRGTKSPTRDIPRTPQRRSMRLSMREHPITPAGSGEINRINAAKPTMIEHNFSPTVINESNRPSVTRKVLQTYKQENPDTFNHVSTPTTTFKHEPSPNAQRKSRGDMPLVFNR